MISKQQIERNLKQINSCYVRAADSLEKLYFSKLAIIELGGWIETSMDIIVKECARRNLSDSDNIKKIDVVVKTTYGFHYSDHFRKMMMSCVGMICLEKIEAALDATKKANLESTLGTLKVVRDTEAHTYIEGVTRIIDAPMVTIARFNLVYPGLKEIEKLVRRYSF